MFKDFTELRKARKQQIATRLRSSTHNFSSYAITGSRSPSSVSLISPSLSMVTTPSLRNDQRRSFFFGSSSFSDIISNVRLKQLERIANQNPTNPVAQYDFLSELYHKHPDLVIERFENFTEYAVDERITLLYLGALQRISGYGLERFNLDSLIKRLTVSEGGVHIESPKIQALLQLREETTVSSITRTDKGSSLNGSDNHVPLKRVSRVDIATKVMQILSGSYLAGGVPLIGGVAGGSAPLSIISSSMRGADAKYPLHVQMINATNFRMALLSFARQIIIAFIVVSALTAVLDEKGMGRAMGINSKHIQEAEGSEVRFDDVKGVEEAKAELEEIVQYLKNPEKFTRLGGKLPRGLLLTGPPGTGKTMLAKAIAGEAGVPFFFSSGSQFEEVYVGLGAKRVRELFEAAKKKAPAIIFIDEIDAVGGTRKLKDQSALKMTLNELLVQMDGFDSNNGIIVIGATNFAESLDSALLRPGRFDKHVTVPLPDVGGRKEILEVYARKTKLAKDVDLNILARGTTGFSGADLSNLINQAAIKASIDGLNSITMAVLEYAKDKILMGAERKTAVITPKTAKCTAYHEAGHALVAVLTEGAMPIHKATIMPRGSALGMVTMLPEGDQTSQSFKEMIAFMDVAMGGRVAEELIFGEENITSGAMSDIANATKIARAMVTKYGFSDEVGIVYHGGDTGEESASDETRAKIDNEVKRLTNAAYERAKDLLKKHSKEHRLLAEALLEYETLTGDEVLEVIKKGMKPKRPIVKNIEGARGDRGLLGSSDTGNEEAKIPAIGGKVGSRRESTN